jgi:glycine/D-amino acid oxidase-like deaminating enzyme
VIDRAPTAENVILATGHGMWGLQLAPLTGRLVAGLAMNEPPEHDLQPLRADRFAPLLSRRRTQANPAVWRSSRQGRSARAR